MKKILCVFMAVMMMLSSVAVLGASAADGYAAKNPVTDRFDSAEEFAAENGEKKIYGYTYDFLCNAFGMGDIIDCSKSGISYTDEDGKTHVTTSDSLSSAYTNLSYYTKMITLNFFGGESLYTEENAVRLINFFGNLVYPEFEEVTVAFGSTVIPAKDDFYKTIVEKSKIWEVVRDNWTDQLVDYSGFAKALGANPSSLTTSDSFKPKAVSRMLIEGILGSVIAYGPVEYIFRTLVELSTNYSAYYNVAAALFRLKINTGKSVKDASGNVIGRERYTNDELRTVEGFLTYVFDGVLDYDFFTFPAERIVKATDDSVKLLAVMSYFAVNYRYKNNAAAIDRLASVIFGYMEKNGRYSQAGYNAESYATLKKNITGVINAIFKGDITVETAAFIGGLGDENVDNVGNDILTSLKLWFSSLLRKIADYFDYIFKILSGEKKYGDDVIEW